MTAKQLVDSPAVRLGVYVFVMGMAYATLKLESANTRADLTVANSKIELLRETLNRMDNKLTMLVAESHQQHEAYCLKRREELGCMP